MRDAMREALSNVVVVCQFLGIDFSFYDEPETMSMVYRLSVGGHSRTFSISLPDMIHGGHVKFAAEAAKAVKELVSVRVKELGT